MLESSDLVAFVAATDLRRARAFYEQTLGLPVLEHNDFACVLDAHGTTLRVTAVPEVARARRRSVAATKATRSLDSSMAYPLVLGCGRSDRSGAGARAPVRKRPIAVTRRFSRLERYPLVSMTAGKGLH